MTEERDYVPIACSLHDELESLAVLREPVQITYVEPDGSEREAHGIVVDVWAQSGAEYLRVEDGTTVRLDRLREVVSSRDRIDLRAAPDPPERAP
ncbi:MAG TPA: hypothetical protein VFQ22_13050 [Longimicrobiales bacterium]|nr:hypothetical protein [Longimicrobiales bacterium]